MTFFQNSKTQMRPGTRQASYKETLDELKKMNQELEFIKHTLKRVLDRYDERLADSERKRLRAEQETEFNAPDVPSVMLFTTTPQSPPIEPSPEQTPTLPDESPCDPNVPRHD